MQQTFTYTITDTDAGKTIKEFLGARGYSRHLLVLLKRRENGITVNGQWAYVTCQLIKGDILRILLPEEEAPSDIPATPLPLSIVYEDADILVVNKAAGMPVHPSIGNYENTLANAVAYYYRSKGEPFTFRCINRLDRDTTGLLILAKHLLSASILSAAMKQREIHRTYLALVYGETDPDGTISLPIGRKADSIIERQVDREHGETAVTHFETLTQFEDYSLVKLVLETGRTHQIRVHMSALGHPLLGDSLYHPQEDFQLISRQALHSEKLEFAHPITGEMLRFTASLPNDMAKLTENYSV